MADLGLHIVTIDYNEECIQLVKNKLQGYKNIQYIVNKELDVPVQVCSIDCIVACESLFYLGKEDESILFANLIKRLKPRGILYADYRAEDDHLLEKGEQIEKNHIQSDETEGHYKYYKKR